MEAFLLLDESEAGQRMTAFIAAGSCLSVVQDWPPFPLSLLLSPGSGGECVLEGTESGLSEVPPHM